jgi:hypothetical protein
MSPLANRNNLDIEVSYQRFKNGLLHLKKWLGEYARFLGKIDISGGEPTLHKDLNRILRFTKEVFPWVQIGLRTNAVNSADWEDSGLVEVLRETNTEVEASIYKNSNIESLKHYNKKYKVKYFIHHGAGPIIFVKPTITQYANTFLAEREHRKCGEAAECRNLSFFGDRDVLFGCDLPCYTFVLDHCFGTHFSQELIEGRDCWDFDISTVELAIDRMNNVYPFCSFCRKHYQCESWSCEEQSKGEPSEWISWQDLNKGGTNVIHRKNYWNQNIRYF